MGWCDSCSAYRAPAALDDGRCPTCGGVVDDREAEPDPEPVGASAPWHFWVVVVLLAAYLLWRVVDFIAWIVT